MRVPSRHKFQPKTLRIEAANDTYISHHQTWAKRHNEKKPTFDIQEEEPGNLELHAENK
jgi:hypothetical protein